MKMLVVGDPHITAASLEEARRLQAFVKQTARDEKVDSIVVLGDQFHNHQTINLEVMRFWKDCLLDWTTPLKTWGAAEFDVYMLVGNHDKRVGTDLTETHALLPFVGMHGVHIIDQPYDDGGGILFVPNYTDHEAFVAACQGFPNTKTVYCHQTFDGAQYENGFFAKDGIDQNLLPQEFVVSGHIHRGAQLGKVHYVGSPRWMTLGDANQEKAIWVIDHTDDGSIRSRKAFDTSNACVPIFVLEDSPEDPAEVPPVSGVDITVDLRGPADYIARRKEQLAAAGVKKFRTFPTREKTVTVRESDGIPVAFNRFAGEFKPKGGTDIEHLLTLAKERISWMRT